MTRFDAFYSRFTREYPYPRQLRAYHSGSFPKAHIFREGKKLIDFSSSDYLGLGKHPFLIARSQEFAKRFGTGSGSSRLVCGNLAIYEQLENQLAASLGKEAALILGTGFQANATILEALLDESVLKNSPLVFCDKSCHASIYTGLLRLSQFHRFHHNDLDHLQLLLNKKASSSQPIFIIVESVYSMDGDQSDLLRLIDLAEKYQAVLYVDDAHAIGIYGSRGWGKAADFSQKIDLIIGTFSKALGSFGAFLACSQVVREYLIHRCKGLIYSTALSPAILGAISASMELLPHLNQERQRVIQWSQSIRKFFDEEELSYGESDSHLVPWIIGSAEKTRWVAQQLEEQGILGVPIQYPTVPSNKNRIRFCVSALHEAEDLELLFSSIKKVKKKLKP
ncbi:MAG TPA: pyridoxal phosphate-dependent aminotransferase family protein [Gammaproteobacteria bacterium]|nr:pyridoxal phosphate-dependent aminotransferase family protein [Gammaproteobacteria bacterium]